MLPVATHNLPHQSTTFIGRTEDLTEIARLLANPACRLLTLVGPGGIGKTQLALRAAEQEIATNSEGVHFVALAPLDDASSIVPNIAEVVGFSFYPGSEPVRQLLDFLHPRHL